LNTIYLICAVAGGTVLLLRLILTLIGLDHGDADLPDDASFDVDTDAAHGHAGGGINLFSMQSIAGFFTMFGLVGMGLLQINVSETLSMIGALLAGGVTALATALIFMQMQKLQSEGTLNIRNAIGKTGTVYLTIPESGTGVVNVTVQGALRTLDAVSQHGNRLPTGTVVKVVDITAGKLLVVTELVEQAADSQQEVNPQQAAE